MRWLGWGSYISVDASHIFGSNVNCSLAVVGNLEESQLQEERTRYSSCSGSYGGGGEKERGGGEGGGAVVVYTDGTLVCL
jgi:hypothetical protein